MRLQLWSYNYAPEVTGIAPVSEVWAKAMMERGHDVEVVAAWPHYPEPKWEHPRRPYRELRDGIPVTRLPLLVGDLREVIPEGTVGRGDRLAEQILHIPDSPPRIVVDQFAGLCPAAEFDVGAQNFPKQAAHHILRNHVFPLLGLTARLGCRLQHGNLVERRLAEARRIGEATRFVE